MGEMVESVTVGSTLGGEVWGADWFGKRLVVFSDDPEMGLVCGVWETDCAGEECVVNVM